MSERKFTYLLTYFFKYRDHQWDLPTAWKTWLLQTLRHLSVLHKHACLGCMCASQKYWCIWLICQYSSASVQFIPNFSKLKVKTSKIVSLNKIRMFPTSVICQCVKVDLCWTNRERVSSCFFKQLKIAASCLRQRP